MSRKILVVEREQSLLGFIAVNLEERGYHTLIASSDEEIWGLVEAESPELLLLDFNSLQPKWVEVCRQIRQLTSVPVLMFLTPDTVQHRVQILNAGVDGYLNKPFTVDELEAHIRALFRRIELSQPNFGQRSPPSVVLQYHELSLDPQTKSVICRNESVKLTPLEFTFLQYMMEHPRQLIDHERLLGVLWGEGHEREPKHLRVYVKRLREKIEVDPANPHYLRSEYGMGYRLGQPIPTETLALTRVNPISAYEFDIVKVIKRIAESLLSLLSVDRCELLVVDKQKEWLSLFTSAGYGSEQDSPSRKFPLDEGLVSWSIHHNRFLTLDSVSQDPRYVAWEDLPVLEEGSIAMMPTCGPDRVHGILIVYRLTGSGFEPENQAMLQLFANQVGLLLSQLLIPGLDKPKKGR